MLEGSVGRLKYNAMKKLFITLSVAVLFAACGSRDGVYVDEYIYIKDRVKFHYRLENEAGEKCNTFKVGETIGMVFEIENLRDDTLCHTELYVHHPDFDRNYYGKVYDLDGNVVYSAGWARSHVVGVNIIPPHGSYKYRLGCAPHSETDFLKPGKYYTVYTGSFHTCCGDMDIELPKMRVGFSVE